MRKIFISIIALYAVTETARCFEVGKDGFNFYKDYLRARIYNIIEDEEGHGDRMIYFYRTPLQLYPGLLPAVLEQEYKKRNDNMFKNRMLNNEVMQLEIPNKRTSKAALSLMMQSRTDPHHSEIENYCFYGK